MKGQCKNAQFIKREYGKLKCGQRKWEHATIKIKVCFCEAVVKPALKKGDIHTCLDNKKWTNNEQAKSSRVPV